ncbi:MAG: hypothetical protein LBJ71_04850 [Holosporaceae bacterium]|jgi:hypothetical protein|nr:hypothetical protein [Holosporaceae bacterium]
MLFAAIKNDGIYLNDIRVIDKKAKKQLTVFKFLLKKQLSYLCDSENVASQWHHIAAQLEIGDANKGIVDEQQVKQIIYIIRKNVANKHNESIANEFIQYDDLYGYHLGRKVTLILW